MILFQRLSFFSFLFLLFFCLLLFLFHILLLFLIPPSLFSLHVASFRLVLSPFLCLFLLLQLLYLFFYFLLSLPHPSVPPLCLLSISPVPLSPASPSKLLLFLIILLCPLFFILFYLSSIYFLLRLIFFHLPSLPSILPLPLSSDRSLYSSIVFVSSSCSYFSTYQHISSSSLLTSLLHLLPPPSLQSPILSSSLRLPLVFISPLPAVPPFSLPTVHPPSSSLLPSYVLCLLLFAPLFLHLLCQLILSLIMSPYSPTPPLSLPPVLKSSFAVSS